MVDQSPCLVTMEACASAHHWARQMSSHVHEVRLIAPIYVKPFLKRQKYDNEEGPWSQWGRVRPMKDAEAIVEGALRPTMWSSP